MSRGRPVFIGRIETLEDVRRELRKIVRFLNEQSDIGITPTSDGPGVFSDNAVILANGTGGELKDSATTLEENLDSGIIWQSTLTQGSDLTGFVGPALISFLETQGEDSDGDYLLTARLRESPARSMTWKVSYSLSGDSLIAFFERDDGTIPLRIDDDNTIELLRLQVYRDDTDTLPAAIVEQDGSGDATLQFLLTGGESFCVGIDNNDGDKFKISDHTILGVNDVLVADSSRNVAVGNSSPGARFHVEDDAAQILIIERTSSNANAQFDVKNGGQAYRLGLKSDNHFYLRDQTADADLLRLGTDGDVGVPSGIFYGHKESLTLGVAATTFAITSNFVVLTGDGGGNTIATITGGVEGQRLVLLFVDGNVTITDDNTHAADSVDLSAAFTSADDTVLELLYDGTSWYEISRSVN